MSEKIIQLNEESVKEQVPPLKIDLTFIRSCDSLILSFIIRAVPSRFSLEDFRVLFKTVYIIIFIDSLFCRV